MTRNRNSSPKTASSTPSWTIHAMSNESHMHLVPSRDDLGETGRYRLPFGLSYSSEEFRKDLIAGLTVSAISLPQGMAYALLAGVDPRFGLYSAIIVTAVASIFGSSSW